MECECAAVTCASCARLPRLSAAVSSADLQSVQPAVEGAATDPEELGRLGFVASSILQHAANLFPLGGREPLAAVGDGGFAGRRIVGLRQDVLHFTLAENLPVAQQAGALDDVFQLAH